MKKVLKKKQCIAVMVIVFCFSLQTIMADEIQYKKVSPDKLKDVLKMLTNRTSENYKRIKTWEGAISFNDALFYYGDAATTQLENATEESVQHKPEKVKMIYEGTVDFKVDLANAFMYQTLKRPKPVRVEDLDSGQIYATKRGPVDDIIIQKSSYRIESYVLRRDKEGAVIERGAKKVPNQFREVGGFVDPREFFNAGQFARPVWIFLSEIENWVESGTSGITVEKGTSADDVFYRINVAMPDTRNVRDVLVFSGNAGFNPVTITVHADGQLFLQTVTEYKRLGAIYIPTSRHESKYEDGNLFRESRYDISRITINEAIPKTLFADANCGLSEGQILIDYTNNRKEFVLRGGRFVESKKKEDIGNDN